MKSLSVKSSKALNEFLVISQLDSEKKVLRRKHFDTNIRIKNIEREIVNRSKTLSRVSESSVMMKNDNKVTKNCDDHNHDNVIVNVTTSDDDENDSVSIKAKVPCDIDPDDDEFALQCDAVYLLLIAERYNAHPGVIETNILYSPFDNFALY